MDLFRFDPPELPDSDLRRIADDLYGVTGTTTRLRGERSNNTRFTTADGEDYVLRIASAGEPGAAVECQALALVHIEQMAPQLPIVRMRAARNGQLVPTVEIDACEHRVRLETFLPGTTFDERQVVSLHGLRLIGELLGGVAAALAFFDHPAAFGFMPWDIANGLVLEESLHCQLPDDAKDLTIRARARLETAVERMEGLPRQVIHNDGHAGNLLRSAKGSDRVTGLIDFGDLVHTVTVADIAVSAASLAPHQPDPMAALASLATGYHAYRRLTSTEVEAIPDLVLARLVLSTLMIQYQLTHAPHLAASVAAERPGTLANLARWLDVDPRLASDRIAGKPVTDEQLLRRRAAVLAPSYQLFYDEPVHLVRGDGVWLFDVDGNRYLDCYNNVPSVGHAHPRVIATLAAQTGLLNTHTRYLHEHVVELAERLGASLPGDLSTCYFVCTGTEANDLAVQIARVVTGAVGVMVTEHSYHGNSDLVGRLSTDSYPESERPDWLAVVEPPNTYRGPFRAPEPDLDVRYATLVDDALDDLAARGHRIAAMLIDTSWDSNGVLVAPGDYVARAAFVIRDRGGLVIADEVQAGYCRLGLNFWGHTNYELVPDIVTIGKPMGAGHPVAAVVTTPAIASAFAERRNYFNTFGGNPVSAAVALTVLDVIEDEQLLDNAAAVGGMLGSGLRELAARHEVIGNVQGGGLFWGVDMVADRATRQPVAYADAKHVATELRRRGILAGVTGRYTNVLKLRPPLVFRPEHVDLLVTTLDDVLASMKLRGGDDTRAPGAEW